MFCLHFLPDNLQPTTNRASARNKSTKRTHPRRNGLRVEAPGGSNRQWSCWCRAHPPVWRCQVIEIIDCWDMLNPLLLASLAESFSHIFGGKAFLTSKNSMEKTKKNVLQVPRKDMKQALHSLLGVGTSHWLQLSANVTRCHSTQPRPRPLKSSTNAELDGCGYFQMEDSGLKLNLSRILNTANASWSVDPWQLAVLITWQNKHQKGENLQKM